MWFAFQSLPATNAYSAIYHTCYQSVYDFNYTFISVTISFCKDSHDTKFRKLDQIFFFVVVSNDLIWNKWILWIDGFNILRASHASINAITFNAFCESEHPATYLNLIDCKYWSFSNALPSLTVFYFSISQDNRIIIQITTIFARYSCFTHIRAGELTKKTDFFSCYLFCRMTGRK